ncbi:hypothetical protein QQ045_005599 [Rhodiola kirilowii]
MCPLRFILVFFSAVLAGYFAWKSISADDHDDDLANFDDSSSQKQQETNFIQASAYKYSSDLKKLDMKMKRRRRNDAEWILDIC